MGRRRGDGPSFPVACEEPMTYFSDEFDAIEREELLREQIHSRRVARHQAQHWHPNDPDYEPIEPEDEQAE